MNGMVLHYAEHAGGRRFAELGVRTGSQASRHTWPTVTAPYVSEASSASLSAYLFVQLKVNGVDSGFWVILGGYSAQKPPGNPQSTPLFTRRGTA